MNGRYHKYIFLFLTLIGLDSFGQDDGFPEEDAYEPDSLYTVRDAIKIDPVQIIFGDYRIYYEHILSGHYSFEVGAGFTRRNYASGWFDYELDNFGNNVDINTGGSFSFSLRRYFKDYEELNGAYVAAGVNHRFYTKDFGVIDSSGVLTDFSFRDRRGTTSVIFKVGYQALPLASNVFADFYTGPAIRFKDFDIVRTTALNDPSSYSVETLDEITFGWEVGVRIGFGF